MKLHLLLEMAAEADPDRVIIGARADGMTLDELLQSARRAAAWLASKPGNAVAYLGYNDPAFAVALFAASMSGRSFTPLNYRLPDEDLRTLAARSAPAVAICNDGMMERLAGVGGVHVMGLVEFSEIYGAASKADALPESDNEIAVTLFTSGTTSEPKAAVLRHHNLTSYVLSTVEFFGADNDDAALVSVPPYHIAGISAVLTSVYSGRRMVQLEAFTPESWVAAVSCERITHAMVVPTMLGRVLAEITEKGLSLGSLRALSYGGGRMPAAVVERAMDLLPHVGLVNAYGLTETSSTISILDPESHRTARAASDPCVRRRLSSVGRPLPSLELEIRDQNGAPVGAETHGEIWVRGEQISGEYHGREAVRDDGWFPTNDAGWLDDEGYLFVEGRLDDVIVRGGENIAPAEIEDVLRAHTSVLDVAVLGMPDDEWGERIIAAVVIQDVTTAQELQAHVRDRLRSSRVPEQICFLPELPYNETGKLLRRALKAQFSAVPPIAMQTT